MWRQRWFACFWTLAVVLLTASCIAEESADQDGDYITLYDQFDNDGVPNIIPENEPDIIFGRERRKYSRRLWYINCTRRHRCHCYSRQLRQYFCCACDSGPCFPGDSKVILMPSGDLIPINKLRIGQYIQAANEDGQLTSSKVLGFLDKRPNETAPYITLALASGHAVSLSANHLLYVTVFNNSTNGNVEGSLNSIPSHPVFAGQVQLGHYLYIPEEGELRADPVVGITYGFKLGAYVPLTEHGSIIVDGALASCYASFPHWLSHAMLMPARYFPGILLDTEDSQDNPGLRTFPSILKMKANQKFEPKQNIPYHNDSASECGRASPRGIAPIWSGTLVMSSPVWSEVPKEPQSSSLVEEVDIIKLRHFPPSQNN